MIFSVDTEFSLGKYLFGGALLRGAGSWLFFLGQAELTT